MTNKSNTTLYTGVTANLLARIHTHKFNPATDSFVKRYRTNKLVYFEQTNDIRIAIAREKEIKGWSRKKKEMIILKDNPSKMDLSKDWYETSRTRDSSSPTSFPSTLV